MYSSIITNYISMAQKGQYRDLKFHHSVCYKQLLTAKYLIMNSILFTFNMYQYPQIPPPESQLQYVEKGLAFVKHNPRGVDKIAKFCPICDVPIHVRVVLSPCQHFACYDCFMVKPIECRFCTAKVSSVYRPSDLKSFYSCDDCFLYFENQTLMNEHMNWH